MRFRRSKKVSEHPDPRLGLDSVSFDTFGWRLQHDHGNHRLWLGEHDGLHLGMMAKFTAGQPWFSSFDTHVLRDEYQRMRSADPALGDFRVVEVDTDPRVPVVQVVVRVDDPEHDYHATWEGSLTIPLAHYGWVIMIQAQDGGILLPGDALGRHEDVQMTGLRESFAFDAWARENLGPDIDKRTFDERVAGFDPYDRRWDDIVPGHQLTTVRNYLDRLRGSVSCGPEFYDQAPFRAAGNSTS